MGSGRIPPTPTRPCGYAAPAHPGDGATSVRPHSTMSATATGSTAGSRAFTYDTAGNMTGRPGPTGAAQTLTWDETGNLVDVSQGGVSVAKMVYGATGDRLVRQQNGATTVFVAGAQVTLTGTVVSATRYYSHHGQTVAARSGNTNADVTTLVPDWQGTTHMQINNSTGAITVQRQDPYGQPRGSAPTGWVGERGFVGGIKDATGLTRVGARDYDPVLGQFVTTDPQSGLDDPSQANAYAYAGNNPVTMSDPSGLKPLADGNYIYKGSNEAGWSLYTKPVVDKKGKVVKPAKLVLKENAPVKTKPSTTPKSKYPLLVLTKPAASPKKPANPALPTPPELKPLSAIPLRPVTRDVGGYCASFGGQVTLVSGGVSMCEVFDPGANQHAWLLSVNPLGFSDASMIPGKDGMRVGKLGAGASALVGPAFGRVTSDQGLAGLAGFTSQVGGSFGDGWALGSSYSSWPGSGSSLTFFGAGAGAGVTTRGKPGKIDGSVGAQPFGYSWVWVDPLQTCPAGEFPTSGGCFIK